MSKQTRFWSWAKVTHSLPRLADGVKKYRLKYELMFGRGKFVRFRRYKGPNDEIRRTIEIEI